MIAVAVTKSYKNSNPTLLAGCLSVLNVLKIKSVLKINSDNKYVLLIRMK